MQVALSAHLKERLGTPKMRRFLERKTDTVGSWIPRQLPRNPRSGRTEDDST